MNRGGTKKKKKSGAEGGKRREEKRGEERREASGWKGEKGRERVAACVGEKDGRTTRRSRRRERE